MRFLFVILILIVLNPCGFGQFEVKHGIGLVVIYGIPKDGLRHKYNVKFYNSLNDSVPSQTMNLQYGSSDFYRQAKLLNYKRYRFGSLIMVCLEKTKDAFKVRIYDDQEYWIKNEALIFKDYRNKKVKIDHYEFVPWSEMISRAGWVYRETPSQNKLKEKPTLNSDTINHDFCECFSPGRTKDYWIEIFPDNGEEPFENGLGKLKNGKGKLLESAWILWRNESDFLIKVNDKN